MNFNKIHEVMPYPWGGLDESWILPYPNKPSYFSNLNTKPTQLNYPIVAPRLGKNMWWLEKQSMFNFANLLRKLRNIACKFFLLLGRLFCAHRIHIWSLYFSHKIPVNSFFSQATLHSNSLWLLQLKCPHSLQVYPLPCIQKEEKQQLRSPRRIKNENKERMRVSKSSNFTKSEVMNNIQLREE